MINKDIHISIPMLWGEEHFVKNQWGSINYIVGPNGTGKTLFAEQIRNVFSYEQIRPRYLNAERLMGLEKQGIGRYGGASLQGGFDMSNFGSYKSDAEATGLSSSAIIILKQRLDIRIRIEALLSDIFGKTIRLVEEGGFLKPKMQNKNAGIEYNLSQSECHGLKELITLLTFLYDPENSCLILDEPELHLHPQYQSFFLDEIRKIAGNPIEDPKKKLFFIITHSPYFIDLKSIDDLKNILVCHLNEIPTYIDEISDNDQYILKRFLPRFNTHHKQFFFSPNPVFVEGYTDQQIISILFEKIGINIGASGSCIIDVGGKNDLGVFYNLCKSLKINCRVIADLDAMFDGHLLRVVREDERSQSFIQQQGVGISLGNEIGDLKTRLSSVANYIIGLADVGENVNYLKQKLELYIPEDEDKKRVSMLLGLLKFEHEIRPLLDEANLASVNLILGKINQLWSAFKTCHTYILPKGEIENYYAHAPVDFLNIPMKDNLFHGERDYLLEIGSKADVEAAYPELIELIKEAVPVIEIEIRKHLRFEIFEWIHRVQTGIASREINNSDELVGNTKVNYPLYNQILDLQNLLINDDDRTFECEITLKEALTGESIDIQFNHNTTAHNFDIPEPKN